MTTQRGGNDRRGEYTECTLTPSNVSQINRLFSLPVEGLPFAQPLLAQGVSTIRGTLDVLYVATTHNDLYAFDATGNLRKPIWHVSTGQPVDFRDPSVSGWGNTNPVCTGLVPQAGILSTPVLATVNGTLELFVVSETLLSKGNYLFWLQAYNAGSGALIGAQIISGTNFNSNYEIQRGALTYSSGTIYVPFGSHCDTSPWNGFVFAFNASTLAQAPASPLCTSCTAGGAAIWQGGSGLVVDGSGNLYAMTGNGGGGANDNSFLQLTSGLSINAAYQSNGSASLLDPDDLDLGSGAPILVQSQGVTRVVGGGKQGLVFILDPANMAGPPNEACGTSANCSGTTGNTENVACTVNCSGVTGSSSCSSTTPGVDETYAQILGAPTYWTSSSTTHDKLFVWGEKDYVRRFATDPVNKTFTLDLENTGSSGAGISAKAGGALAISENTTGDSAILWANTRNDALSSANFQYYGVSRGHLLAMDPTTLNVLWDSTWTTQLDLPGYAKFNPPIIANGRVYQASYTRDDRYYQSDADFCSSSACCSTCTTSVISPFPWGNGQSGTSCGSLTGSIEVYGTSAVQPRRMRRDIDANGAEDILWRDIKTGEVSIWFMSNGSVQTDARHVHLSGGNDPGLNWHIQFRGDFNGDGYADILWRDDAGDVAIWLMQGSTVLSGPIIANRCNDLVIQGVGDFNNDGKDDILWEDTNPSSTCGTPYGLAIWLMNGTTIQTDIGNAAGGTKLAAGRNIAGVADFDGDGVDDILFRDTSPYDTAVSVWLMSSSNGAIKSQSTLRSAVCADWTVQNVGDIDHDGTADIYWRDTNPSSTCATPGETAVWLMAATNSGGTSINVEMPQVRLASGPGAVPFNWTLSSTGDVDGDGHTDFLWEDSNTGNIVSWLVTAPGFNNPDPTVTQVRQDLCHSCQSPTLWTGVPLNEWVMTRY